MPNLSQPLTAQEYKNAIYIDFEGEGNSKNGICRMPHMVGTYVLCNERGKYSATLFKEEWKPIDSGCRSSFNTSIQAFGEYFDEIRIKSRTEDRKIIAWSSHEEEVLKIFLNASLFRELTRSLHNLLPPTKRYCSKKNLRMDDGLRPRSLEEYYALICPKRADQPRLINGAAETCRRLDRCCKNKNRWTQFSEEQKQYARDLLAYNKGDCLSTFTIAKRIGNFFSNC